MTMVTNTSVSILVKLIELFIIKVVALMVSPSFKFLHHGYLRFVQRYGSYYFYSTTMKR
jgi:hypothetical protein